MSSPKRINIEIHFNVNFTLATGEEDPQNFKRETSLNLLLSYISFYIYIFGVSLMPLTTLMNSFPSAEI